MYFALIKASPLVNERDLFWLAKVLEVQVKEAAVFWELEPPAFDVVELGAPLPDFCQPIVFLDDETNPGALAIHFVDKERLQPAARVFCQRASGFNTGPYSVTSAASHEALEALVDPWCNRWLPHPDPARGAYVSLAVESCDPPQTEYAVSGHGGDWLVSNYVLPSYFDGTLFDPTKRAEFLASGGRFDRRGELTAPGEVGPRGYVILQDQTGVWTEDHLGAEAMRVKPGALHPWGRTTRRGPGE